MKSSLFKKVYAHLEKIYPGYDLNAITKEALDIFNLSGIQDNPASFHPAKKWSETDIILITYGNTITDNTAVPLQTLDSFLEVYLNDLVSIVHILPFFPFSSDDGFAVMDYYTVNPDLGDWNDIQTIAQKYRVMGDVVINHTSAKAQWFDNFKKDLDPGKGFYLTVDPDCDLSHVIRPRTSPLLKKVKTENGPRLVWCTFSHDQIDLDFKNPKVLLEFLAIIRFYIDHGIRVFRLDAVAFLWKESCTTCLHLHQTHEIIKLFRSLTQAFNAEVLLLTETNVPSKENMSYLGNGDEAHIIYSFPLPPLLIHTLVTGSSQAITLWLMSQPEMDDGTTLLNFIASHDGIGLRPVETHLIPEEQIRLLQCMEAFGGRISTRAVTNKTRTPYEINISLWDAMKGTAQNGPDQFQLQRFICAHAIMLCLKGIPAFYIHSLLGTENDYERREKLDSFRAVNRHVWEKENLLGKLENTNTHHYQVFSKLTRLIQLRKQQPAFHPDAFQKILGINDHLVVILRQTQRNQDRRQTIVCIHNISDQPCSFKYKDILTLPIDTMVDLKTGKTPADLSSYQLQPYEFLWYEIHPNS